MIAAAQKHGVNLFSFPGGSVHPVGAFHPERSAIYNLVDADRFAGLVSSGVSVPGGLDPQAASAFLRKYQPLPVVSLTQLPGEIPYVMMNSSQGMQAVMLHLLQTHGLNRVAFVRGPEHHHYAQERYRAYVETLQQQGIPFEAQLVTPPLQWEAGEDAVHILFEQRGLRPGCDLQAIVTVSDLAALGVLKALQARGVQVPGDLALTGFNDSAAGRLTLPPLTSVSMPFHEQGEQAIEMLVTGLAGHPILPQMLLSTRLVVRQSCGCPDQAMALADMQPISPSQSASPGALAMLSREAADEIARDMHPAGETLASITQLVEALCADLQAESQTRFLPMLESMLRSSPMGQDTMTEWNDAVSVLRRLFLPQLDSASGFLAEKLFGQARILIGGSAQRAQAFEVLQAERQAGLLRELGQSLITTFDVARLADILAERLPVIGIASCYLALYENSSLESCLLILAYTEQGRVDLGSAGRRFPSHELVPADFLPQHRQYSYVVEPLYFEHEQIGFAIFEVGPHDGAIYELLRSQISSALKGALLLQEATKAKARLTHEALHDPLTNLPNRRLFVDRVDHAIQWNKRHPNDLFAVIYLDFDRFKVINDSLGHNVGDQLLVILARRLKSSVRTMDIVARMGGDEFAILLEAVKSDEDVIEIVKRIQENLATPCELERNSIVMTASIGIVMSIIRYERTDNIIQDADIAMYGAKISGGNRFVVFDVVMREQVDGTLKLESGLRSAIRNGEFRIHYQPILSLKTQRLTGFEALIRWEHPQRGLLYPADFIRTAEESGLIVPMGQWVLYEACRQMSQWQTQFTMEPPLTISVNLSSRQFLQPDLIPQIAKVLEETCLPASSLILELTEMTLIEDIETAIAKIEQLHALGVGVELDDFGTGYSSLGYLRRLPVNSLKIDRSFISTMGVSKSGVPIVRAIIAMANSLNMKVVAEGIETHEQTKDLVELECDYGQGFLFSKPVDNDIAHRLIQEMFSKPSH
jgi:diguanylate cyclase (GGDEF)-like protein